MKYTGIELKSMIKHMISNNDKLAKDGIRPVSINIVGHAGIAKSSIAKSIAEDLNMRFVKISLSQLQELGDIVGMPMEKSLVSNGEKKKWVPSRNVKSLSGTDWLPTGHTKMSYSIPEWALAAKNQNTILCLDDFTRAEPHFQQAIMEIIHLGEYVSWKLPMNTQIIMTSNPTDDEYNVTEVDLAQSSRCATYTMKWDPITWTLWAEGKIPTHYINFINRYPEMVDKVDNIRRWTMFFNATKYDDPKSDMTHNIGSGMVTEEKLIAMSMFMRKDLASIPDVSTIYSPSFEEPNIKGIESAKKACDKKHDIKAYMENRLIAHVIHSHKDKEFTLSDKAQLKQIILSEIFSEDLNTKFIKLLYAHDQNKFAKLMVDNELGKYFGS